MKKSNILIVAAAIFILLSMLVYNTALKAEFLSGAHKDPYHNFKTLNLKDFDAVAVNAGSEVGVKIQAGKETNVRVRKDDEEYIKFKVVNRVLMIDVAYKAERRNYDGRERVIVTLPALTAVTTDSKYTVDGKAYTWGRENGNKEAFKGWSNGYTIIKGFTQDSLTINQDNASKVILQGNKLGLLRAITGKAPGSTTELSIQNSNNIAQANLDIRSKSSLELDNVAIPKITYQFSDSAKTSISGASLAILKK